MPYYDLSCKNCLHQFNVKATSKKNDRLMVPGVPIHRTRGHLPDG